MYKLPIITLLGILLLLCRVQAQNSDTNPYNSLTGQKMNWYGIADKGLLFVHFDKNIYTGNEPVWFTGYLLRPPVHVDSNRIMAVALVRNDDSVVMVEGKYFMDDGVAFGNMYLPASLEPGFYSLIAYTNIIDSGKPRAMFVQPVTIKSEVTPTFQASLKLAPKAATPADSVKVLLKADTKDIYSLVSNAEVSYSIGSGKQKITGKTKTDTYGAAAVTLPVKDLTATTNLLKVQVNHKNEKRQLQIRLPLVKNAMRVGIYPESGHLVAGYNNRIGWEVRMPDGMPLKTPALLYKNGAVADTIRTNEEGLGEFLLFAETGSNYAIRILNKEQPDTLYRFPKVVAGIPLLQIKNAVPEDSLRITVSSKQEGKWYCLIHNYTELFAGFDVTLEASSNRGFVMPLGDIPRGVVAVTLLNAAGEPVSERMAFVHYGRKQKLSITTDSAAYRTRQKVTVKLKFNGADTGTTSGMLSVACVQENRLDARNTTDIESYTYLHHQLADLPFRKNPMMSTGGNEDYLNKVLLIKGWRKYNWQDVQKSNATDTLQMNMTRLKFYGNVKRPPADTSLRPIQVAMVTGTSLQTLMTRPDGSFDLREEDMQITPDKKLMFIVNVQKKEGYGIDVKDPYADINRNLFAWLTEEQREKRYVSALNTDSMALKAAEKRSTLATVTVSNDAGVSQTTIGRNACGDYVCLYNILNCRNHYLGGTMPVEGKSYYIQRGPKDDTVKVVYQGCAESRRENRFALFMKGIYTGKEFYAEDYTRIGPSETMFLSTLYWNYATAVNSAGETELSFYTSDITGRFRIVAQGVTSSGGVTYAESSFTVRSQ